MWTDGDWGIPELAPPFRAYAELAGAPRGAEIDLIAALTHMISYNGGRPLTCHA